MFFGVVYGQRILLSHSNTAVESHDCRTRPPAPTSLWGSTVANTLIDRAAEIRPVTDLLDTYIENRWIVNPNHANIVETAHGGNVVKWMDEAGAMAAMRFAGETCVTVRMNSVDFKRPIRTGDTALIEAYAYDAGETSVKVRLRAYREDLRTGDRELTSESYFIYVAIDEDRSTVSVPELTVSSEEGQELLDAALEASPENLD